MNSSQNAPDNDGAGNWLYVSSRKKHTSMIIELYASPAMPNQLENPESPISNTKGELPDEEPTLELGDLIGSFDSREEAIAFVQTQASEQNRQVIDTKSGPFNAYTHVEWLTVTVSATGDQTARENYYLVSDEGY